MRDMEFQIMDRVNLQVFKLLKIKWIITGKTLILHKCMIQQTHATPLDLYQHLKLLKKAHKDNKHLLIIYIWVVILIKLKILVLDKIGKLQVIQILLNILIILIRLKVIFKITTVRI